MLKLAVLPVLVAVAFVQGPARGSNTAAPLPSQELRIITVRDAANALKGYFQTRPGAYRKGISLPLKLAMPSHQQSLRTEDGRVVNGFGFYAWDQGSVTQVRVLVLVPAAGVENKYLWAGRGAPDPTDQFEVRELASYQLSMGEGRRVDEMKRFGMEPMQIKLDSTAPTK